MNDQDYIRKAVELADGWAWSWDGAFCDDIGPHLIFGRGLNPLPYALDALAAQLVRQVDAVKGGFVEIKNSYTTVGSPRTLIRENWHEGRAMNTLKAIVDSGVLSDD